MTQTSETSLQPSISNGFSSPERDRCDQAAATLPVAAVPGALELLAEARRYVPSLTRLAGQIDVLLGLEGVPVSEQPELVLESYGRGHAYFRVAQ